MGVFAANSLKSAARRPERVSGTQIPRRDDGKLGGIKTYVEELSNVYDV